jgi:hypothetical protein
MSIKAFADNPTLKCHGSWSIDATLQNPVFDLYMKPNVINHRISWTVSSAFHAHVSYAFELVHFLDGTVSDKVNGIITKPIQDNEGKINKGWTMPTHQGG